MGQLLNLVSENRVVRITRIHDTLLLPSTTLIFIHHGIGVVSTVKSKNPVSYLNNFKASCKNGIFSAFSMRDLSTLSLATQFVDWEIYQTKTVTDLNIEQEHIVELLGYKIIEDIGHPVSEYGDITDPNQ